MSVPDDPPDDPSDATPGVIAWTALASLELDSGQPEIYDRPIGLRLLFQDPVSGAEHYLIRYPEGLRVRRHRHTSAHTIIVLEGAIEADGTTLEAGGYAHFPAQTVHHHGPVPGRHALFVIIFHGPFDAFAVD